MIQRRGLVLGLLVGILGVGSAMAATWEVSVYGGVAAGGEIYQAETVSGDTQPWVTPDDRRVEGTEIQAELYEIVGAGVRVRRILPNQFSLQLAVGGADMDVGGVRRTIANSVDEAIFDQVLVVVADLTLHYDLAAEKNTPYVLAGFGFASADFLARPGEAPDLDQSGLGISLGVGYRLRSLDGFHFDLEARDTILGFDADPEAQRLAATSFEAIEFSGADRLHFWQISAAWVFGF